MQHIPKRGKYIFNPPLGKFDPRLLKKIVYPRLGARRAEVLVGPMFGVDNAIVRIGKNRVMALTTDPISLIPALGAEDSAWLSVHNLASDLTTSGFPPAYVVVDFNLPPRMSNSEFQNYWRVFEEEFRRLGAMIVGGHTGRFEGSDYTIIGGATLIAIGNERNYISSNMAQVGDSLLVTKSAAFSSAAILARVFPERIEMSIGTRGSRKAQSMFRGISSVREALALASLGVRESGVSAMHDATEGGIFAALFEMLTASGVGGIVKKSLIPVLPEVRSVCKLFSMDPYTSLSEGSLIVSVKPNRTDDARTVLAKLGVASDVVGVVTRRSKGIMLRTEAGEERLRYPRKDPYWNVYWRGVREGWT